MGETGKTKDSGYQVGARKTFDVQTKEAWDCLFSGKGLPIWLGNVDIDMIEVNKQFTTSDAITFRITTLQPFSHLRMKWKKENWKDESILQVRVIPSNEKTTISFHQEKLSNSKTREEMKQHWKSVLEKLGDVIFQC